MPVRAAFWIAAMVVRSKVADSRSPAAAGSKSLVMSEFLPWVADASVAGGVVDVEAVQGASRAVPGEAGRVVVAAGRAEQLGQLGQVLGPHLLADAVRAQRLDGSLDVDAGLVDRVAQGVPGVTADDQAAGLRHESAHVADVAAD